MPKVRVKTSSNSKQKKSKKDQLPSLNLTVEQLIRGKGPECAEIIFIGDSATESDIKTGHPLSGDAQKRLQQFCKEVGINYNVSYRTLFIKTRLSYGGTNKKQKTAAVVQALNSGFDFYEIFIDEIRNVKPKVIVPLGEMAFQFLTGENSLFKFRGSILPLRKEVQDKIEGDPGIKIAPTLGAHYLYVDPSLESVVLIDFTRIAECLRNPLRFGNPVNCWIADTYDKFRHWRERHSNATWGVFDIETKFNIPVCIGFALSNSESICVPLLDKRLDSANQCLLWRAVDQLLRQLRWSNQNLKFDIMNLERVGFCIRPESFNGDTTLNAGIIYPEFPKNLGFQNSIYTDMPYFKDEGKESTDRDTLYTYCAKDCLSTYIIKEKQEEEVIELGLQEIQKEVTNLFWPYIRIEKRGLLIDEQQKNKLLAKYDTLYYIQRKLLNKETNSNINPHSPKQVGELVYENWKYPPRKNRTTGGLLTDEDTLSELIAISPNKLSENTALQLVLDCRKLKKVIEYLETPIHPDGRLRSSYNLSGTKTGRSSAGTTTDYLLEFKDGKYILSDAGRSLQTISKHGFKINGEWYGRDLRSIYVPTPGYVFIEGDLSQAEARVDAVLAMDFDMLPLFDTPPGMHVRTGVWIFGREINKKTEKDLYHIAKTVRHAAERNMGAMQFYKIIQPIVPGTTLDFCDDALQTFHDSQPNIRQVFHFCVIEHVKQFRNLVSPQGRRRDFFGKLDHHTFNEAISQIPQATVSDHMKFSIPRINEDIGYNVDFVFECHDSLMAEIKKGKEEKYVGSFKKVTSRSINFRKCSLNRDFDLVIPSEMAISDTNWEEMREIEL